MAQFPTGRASRLLFLFVYIETRWGGIQIHGLALRKILGSIDNDTYVRMGAWKSDSHDILTSIAHRLGLESIESLGGRRIDLNDPSLADLVHTVTII